MIGPVSDLMGFLKKNKIISRGLNFFNKIVI
jgi:hypothetical protein